MYRYLILSLAVALVPGCDLLFPPQDSPPGGGSTGDASLKAFESEEELGEYLAEQITAQNNQWAAPGGGFTRDEEPTFDSADGDASTAGPSAPEAPTDSNGTGGAPPAAEPSDGGTAQGEDAASTGGEFSETTIQEEGVDEADVVKTDGTHLYIINGETLHIVQASPAAQLAALSDVSLEGYGREIYLHNNKVVAITETYGGPVLLEGGVAPVTLVHFAPQRGRELGFGRDRDHRDRHRCNHTEVADGRLRNVIRRIGGFQPHDQRDALSGSCELSGLLLRCAADAGAAGAGRG